MASASSSFVITPSHVERLRLLTRDVTCPKSVYNEFLDPSLGPIVDPVQVIPKFAEENEYNSKLEKMNLHTSYYTGSMFKTDKLAFDFLFNPLTFRFFARYYTDKTTHGRGPLNRRQRVYFYNKELGFKGLVNHSDYVRHHLHTLWMLNSGQDELTFTCPGLAEPADVWVIAGDLAVEDFVLQDEEFDFYNFFDVAHQYLLSDNWMLHILEGTGVRTYPEERDNHTLYQAAFFLATYQFESRPKSYRWFASLFPEWPFEEHWDREVARQLLKEKSEKDPLGKNMCDTTMFALEMCTYPYEKFKKCFRDFLRRHSRDDDLYHQPLTTKVKCTIMRPGHVGKDITLDRIWRFCETGWTCPSCKARLRRIAHRASERLASDISLAEDLFDVRRQDAVPLDLAPPLTPLPAQPDGCGFYAIHRIHHFCGQWCTSPGPTFPTSWATTKLQIAEYRFYCNLNADGRSAYRKLHNRHNYLHDMVLARLCHEFPRLTIFYLKDSVMRKLNITQCRLVLVGELPRMVSDWHCMRVLFDKFFPKPTKQQYKLHPNSLRYPVPGFD